MVISPAGKNYPVIEQDSRCADYKSDFTSSFQQDMTFLVRRWRRLLSGTLGNRIAQADFQPWYPCPCADGFCCVAG